MTSLKLLITSTGNNLFPATSSAAPWNVWRKESDSATFHMKRCVMIQLFIIHFLILPIKKFKKQKLKIIFFNFLNKCNRYNIYCVSYYKGKTVKFSLNELMSEIDESFIEEVYFHDCNKILKKYSKQKIRQNVFCKTASKHKPLKFTYRTAIIVTVVSVFLCMPVYAAISHLLTSALIDDSNRHLIGTETNDRSYIILKDGVYTNEKGKVVDIEELAKSSSEFPESRIVKSSLMPNFIPSSIVEIPTDKSDEMYIIPEIILINNSLCVLTQDNGKGWELTDKDNIVISFDKYKSDITVSQDLIIGYVKDGIMYEGEVFDELSGKYSFSPDEKGEYFFYLLSGSSDYLSLKSGNLEVN